MSGLFPVVADVVSQRYRDLRRAPYKRLIAGKSRVKAQQGALVSGFEIRVVHDAHFSLRMPLNATQQIGAVL